MTRERGGLRTWAWICLAGVALLAAHALDRWAYEALFLPGVYEEDWGRLLRVMGYAPTWLVIAGAVWLETRRRDPSSSAGRELLLIVVLAVAVSGLGSEALKLLFRRERPTADAVGYVFRSFAIDPFSTKGFGMPSGHTMVAFGGATAVARRFRGAGVVLLALAAGCALTRVFAHAHFLSDVVAAGFAGSAAGWWAAGRLGVRSALSRPLAREADAITRA